MRRRRRTTAAAWAHVQKGLSLGRRTIASTCTSWPSPRSTKMPARGRSSHVTRPTASRWPPRTRSIRTMRPRCSMASRSSAPSGKGRRGSRCRPCDRPLRIGLRSRQTASGSAALPHSRLRRSRSCRNRLGRCAAYAKTAAAVPHAYHMPSHIFTRLGYWDEAATTNENAWRISTRM